MGNGQDSQISQENPEKKLLRHTDVGVCHWRILTIGRINLAP
jgi:hypothetical protein